MTKKEWQELYDRLQTIYNEFSIAYPSYKKGRNAQIRDKAEREVDILINKADRIIRNNQEAFELLTGGPNASDQGRTFAYDEFKQSWHFGNDLYDFLSQLKNKINSLSEQN